MIRGRSFIRKHVAPTPWPFVFMACLLAVGWWSMSLHLFSAVRFPVAPHMQHDAEMIHQCSLGVRLGFWIASIGWDSGPPAEYAYDFILFWHFSLSALFYFMIFTVLNDSRLLAPGLPRQILWMLIYPLVCIGIYWMMPREEAHHILSLFLYVPCLSLMTLIVLESKLRRPGRIGAGWLFLALAGLSFTSPIHGKGWDMILYLVIILALLTYAILHCGRLASTLKTLVLQHG